MISMMTAKIGHPRMKAAKLRWSWALAFQGASLHEAATQSAPSILPRLRPRGGRGPVAPAVLAAGAAAGRAADVEVPRATARGQGRAGGAHRAGDPRQGQSRRAAGAAGLVVDRPAPPGARRRGL